MYVHKTEKVVMNTTGYLRRTGVGSEYKLHSATQAREDRIKRINRSLNFNAKVFFCPPNEIGQIDWKTVF
jgi:hypothetical protein